MLVRPRQALDALSISALDLFASALGAFMLLAVSFFPYYLRAPALEEETQGARAELTAAAQALREAEAADADASQAQSGSVGRRGAGATASGTGPGGARGPSGCGDARADGRRGAGPCA